MIKKILFLICLIIFKLTDLKVFYSTMPKAGSHMFTKCLMQLLNKSNKSCEDMLLTNKLPTFDMNTNIIGYHIPYKSEYEKLLNDNGFKCLFFYRDPRDLMISYIFFNIKIEYNQIVSKHDAKTFLFNFDDILNLAINKVNDYYHGYITWIQVKNCCSVKYEDLVGSKGGGNDLLQKHTLVKICKYLNISYDDAFIDKCANGLYGSTATFREGKIGSWKKYFKQNHKELFKKVAGQLLIDLGYEKDLEW